MIPFEKEYIECIFRDWDYANGSTIYTIVGPAPNEFTLELHTEQWHHNDCIVEKIEESIFWEWYWQKSERGGHHYFGN